MFIFFGAIRPKIKNQTGIKNSRALPLGISRGGMVFGFHLER
jgi:hypothetical protein